MVGKGNTIKNLKEEVKRLTIKLEERNYTVSALRESRLKHYNNSLKYQKEAKDKELYVKAFSVLLAAVDEKALAWSLAKEYDRQKLSFDLKQDVHSFTNNNFEDIKEDISKENSNSLDLDNLLRSLEEKFKGSPKK